MSGQDRREPDAWRQMPRDWSPQHPASGDEVSVNEVPVDEQQTTMLPDRSAYYRRVAPGGRAPRAADGTAGDTPATNRDGEVREDEQHTPTLPDRSTIFRDVVRTLATGPLPVIDVDRHMTGPLPRIMLEDIVAARRPIPAQTTGSTPQTRLSRVNLVPFDEAERLDTMADMSTMLLPSLPLPIPVPAEPDQSDPILSAATQIIAIPEVTKQLGRGGGSLSFVASLAKSSGIYALSALAAPLVSLVLAPFLTRHLTTNEYGTLAVLTTAVGLIAGISQLGLSSAFFRAYNYDYSTVKDRRDIVGTVSLLLLSTALPLLAGIFFAAPLIASALLGDSSFAPVVRAAALVCVAQNLTVPGYAWLRAESRALYFSLLSIVSLVITLATNIVLVGIVNLGLLGAVVAMGSGYAAVVVCTAPVLVFRAGIQFRRDIAAGLLAFGLPLVLNFTSYWVLQLSDRFLLARMGTLAETAQYAIAYSLGSVLSTLIISPFTLAWPTSMYAIAKRPDAAHIFALVFRGFGALLYFAAFGLSLTGTLLLQRLFPPAYQGVSAIIAIVAASIVFYGVYFLFMIGANVLRKTWLAAVFTTIGALLNLSLNLVLIPRYGGYGAAASTLVAYAALAAMAFVVNQRMYPLPFAVGSWLLMGALGVILYVTCWRIPVTTSTILLWSYRFGICLLYGLVLLLYGGGWRLVRRVVGRVKPAAPRTERVLA